MCKHLKPGVFLGLVIGTVTAIVTGCNGNNAQTLPGQSPSPSSTPTYSYESGDYVFSFDHGGTRDYLIHVPVSYQRTMATPLVINFHGGGGVASGHRDRTLMNDKSDTAGFIVVYPNGTLRDGYPNGGRYWNPGTGPDGAYYLDTDNISTVDDVGYFPKLLSDIESKFNIDKKRVYLAGFSNGGTLVHRLACEYASQIAGIATIAAPFWNFPSACNPASSVPMIHFHGTGDQFAPYGGGLGACSPAKPRTFISAQETVNVWVSKNGCGATPQTTFTNGNASCVTYTGCSRDVKVSFCTMIDAGHTWPSGTGYFIPGCVVGSVSHDISANDALWDFFQSNPSR